MIKLDAYKRTFRHQCSNLKFQYSQFPPLIIKSGLWGLGTFAATDIIKNELVGEYIAEQFYNEDYDNSQLHNHCGLNYAFTLNEGQVLDAATVGNETRCINHSTGPIMNIEAQVKYVNGDHRIGFYSVKKIRAGQELLFDYGEHYWKLST
ncbi:hypothetical protein AcV5_002126 [Taiwanofungus camphoratus]|nr:hypothetical protein AcV5_002126 [Antrodia cinnamomea]KAI0943958.1 hypothetical protein AcV7_001901 [Antrodia cinnamomea]